MYHVAPSLHMISKGVVFGMTKFGLVTARDPQTGLSTIEYSRPTACEKCGGCGPASHQGSITLQADCRVGDWVRVDLPEKRFLQATAFTYLVPLFGLLLGLFAGYALGSGSDLYTLLGGAAGLCVAFPVMKLLDRRAAENAEWSPRVVEVFGEKPTSEDIGCPGGGA